MVQLVTFRLDDQTYALLLSTVEGVIRLVAITTLPKAPDIVLGVINLRGNVVPVVNVRRRFGLPEREMELTDQVILARTARRTVGLVVDAVTGVVERPTETVTAAAAILPRLGYLEGAATLDDGLILIHNLERFLSLEEEAALEHALCPA